jgi:hypothetical protein
MDDRLEPDAEYWLTPKLLYDVNIASSGKIYLYQ